MNMWKKTVLGYIKTYSVQENPDESTIQDDDLDRSDIIKPLILKTDAIKSPSPSNIKPLKKESDD